MSLSGGGGGGKAGDLLSEGLLDVKGTRSSIFMSSFFSKEANSGSPSGLPLAPLITGTVGCLVVGGGAAVMFGTSDWRWPCLL